MATQLGVLPSQMEGAIKAAANLASGLGIDLEQAMKMVVKANNESFTAFQKLGISIDETRAKAEGLPVHPRADQRRHGRPGRGRSRDLRRPGQAARQRMGQPEGAARRRWSSPTGSSRTASGAITDAPARRQRGHGDLVEYAQCSSAAMGLRGGICLPCVEELRSASARCPPPKLDPKGVTDGAMAMRQALDGVNASLDKLLEEGQRPGRQRPRGRGPRRRRRPATTSRSSRPTSTRSRRSAPAPRSRSGSSGACSTRPATPPPP